MLRTMYSYSSSQLQTLKTSNALYVWFIMIHLFMPWNTAQKKFSYPRVSKFLQIIWFTLPTLTFQYFSSGWKGVLLIPAPCQTWLHLEWQSQWHSERIFCPLSPSHILWKTAHTDYSIESIQFLFRFYIYTHFRFVATEWSPLCSMEW